MFRLLVLAILSVAVHATDIKQRLQNPPAPMNGFNTNAYMGQWFTQFRRAPCSWPGSTHFTDYMKTLMPGGPGLIYNQLSWRSRGNCNRISAKYYIVGPGVFTVVDNIGDSFSGKVIVVATDYKTFAIYWGCTKFAAIGGVCEDPWITAATRAVRPSPAVISTIENILQTRFGITINELQKVPHKKPCPQKKC